MNNFKGFFTFIAFIWLWSCGIWAFAHGIYSGEIAWFGLLLNAWALPVWMLLRYFRAPRYSGDLRETPAFTALLVGLAVVLLTDSEKGMPLYLAIYNLFAVLVYLFHLSALTQPHGLPAGEPFPALNAVGGQWRSQQAASAGDCAGLLLVFLRGSYCADSRCLLAGLQEIEETLARRNICPVLISTESRERWRRWWPAGARGEWLQLNSGDDNPWFVAAAGAPLWIRLLGGSAAACRPGIWLLERDGTVVWRHLPGNYRVPGNAEMLRGQLFRIEEDE
ncbi:hypothetical protein [Microbulbifer sp. SAOS-129_SWC]|uniref:hypothetical protein n=1 Tax=Microbulbifer sp. SAOS-129_SWC TaxID=3145235 RepID=UPI0032165145